MKSVVGLLASCSRNSGISGIFGLLGCYSHAQVRQDHIVQQNVFQKGALFHFIKIQGDLITSLDMQSKFKHVYEYHRVSGT